MRSYPFSLAIVLMLLSTAAWSSDFDDLHQKARDSRDPDERVALYSKAIQAWTPDDTEKKKSAAYADRGFAYLVKGLYAPAISDCSRALILDAGNVSAYATRAHSYMNEGNYAAGLADCSKALALQPRYADAYSARGEIRYHQGAYADALRDFEKARQLQSPDLQDAVNIAAVYYMQGKLDTALKAVEPVMAATEEQTEGGYVYPAHGDAYVLKVTILRERNDKHLGTIVEKAEAYLRKQIADRPTDADNYRILATVLLKQGDRFEEAVKLAEQAFQLAPSANNISVLGTAYFRNGDTDKALHYLKRSLELNPASTKAMYNLGKLLRRTGDLKQAEKVWQDALKINPHERLIQEALVDIGAAPAASKGSHPKPALPAQ